MIVVNYHDDLKEVQGDAVLADLLSAPNASSPFGRLDWWENLRDNCGLCPVLAVCSEGHHRAVLPLRAEAKELAGLENWYSFHLALLFTDGAPRSECLAALAASLKRRTAHVTLSKLSEADAAAIESAFGKNGWMVWREPIDINHRLSRDGRSFADFLAGRPGAVRTTLKRKSGKLQIALHRQFDEQTYAQYEEIYAESWKPAEGSSAFLRRFAAEEGAAGRLLMGLAYDGDRAVAAQLWTIEKGTAFIHKLAYRADARSLSPGTVLLAAMLQEVMDRDQVEEVDFGTGDDAYKRDWMETASPRYRLDMLLPYRPANWPLIARHTLRRAAGRG